MSRINPEARAAEIVALIATTYKRGGWFAAMTPGEQAGWDMHEREAFTSDGEPLDERAPRNAREAAGWLAREVSHPFEHLEHPRVPPPCAAAMGCLCVAHARGLASDWPCSTSEER